MESYDVLSFDVGFYTMSYVYYNIKIENLNKVKEMVCGNLPDENIIDLKLVGASNIIPDLKHTKLKEEQNTYYGNKFAKELNKKIGNVDLLIIEDQTINERTGYLEHALACNFNPTFMPIHIKPSIKNEIKFNENLTFAEITANHKTKPQKEHTWANFKFFCERYGYNNIVKNIGKFKFDISDAFCQSLMIFKNNLNKIQKQDEKEIQYFILFEK